MRKTLEETLQEVMKHAVSGQCRKAASFGWHCNDPLHALHIFADNGYVVTNDFSSNAEWLLSGLSGEITIPREIYGDGSAGVYSESNRFDPPYKKEPGERKLPSLPSADWFEHAGVSRSDPFGPSSKE